jgi:type IV pilus assembly protein PilB
LLRFLQRNGSITPEQVAHFEEMALQSNLAIQELLEREGVISEKDLAVLLASHLRLRLIDLTSFPLDPQVARTLKEQVAAKYEVIPVHLEEGAVEVVTANPLDQEALKAVEFNTGRRARPAVATRLEVRDALAHAYRLQESLEQFLQHVPSEEKLTITELQDDGADLRSLAHDSELPPVVKLADLLLIEGIKGGASDVHVEPNTDAVQVRYRIDGILEEAFRFPKWVQAALLGRLKVMAKLDITERRVPQDGRIQIRYQDRIIDLRVSSLPTQHGEKMTFRILDSTRAVVSLDKLGYNATDLHRMREAGRRPQGMILVTGPTGSGKSTTLYALIREIFSPSINIVTIENPVEYQLKGINQVEINEKQGLTFAGVLRSVLRQDPDVVLVGEIRDKETALIACQAAQTGHLVLSTVHTNNAAATITRMIDLGIEPFVLASSLNLIVAQRLVRRICKSCSAPHTGAPEDAMRQLRLEPGTTELRRGIGCPACRQSGYTGRVGVYEVWPISPAMGKLIEANAGETPLRNQARTEGYSTLLEDSLNKLTTGVTTIDEVMRVVQVNESTPRCSACQKEVADEYTVCPHCGHLLRATCGGCAKPMDPSWVTCPYCGGAPAKPGGRTAPNASADAAANTPPSEPAPEFQPRTFKALVVDDQPDLRHIVRLALENSDLGLTVVTAQDGAEALALVDIERPDVVILDVSMPGMDGFEVCRRLRADIRTVFVPVLMLTANDSAESVQQGFGAGSDDYITKPFRREDLIARVRRMIERTYGRDSIPGAGAKGAGSSTGANAPAASASTAAGPSTKPRRPGDDGWLH